MVSRRGIDGTRFALVLRPEPGASETAARLTALGVPVRCCPLFVVSPVDWTVPDTRAYDALLLTSANAVRHAGARLRALAALPVLAVGEATATAAYEAGLTVALTGRSDAADLVAHAVGPGFARLLHLAGKDRMALPGVDQVTVYASDPAAIDTATVRGWSGQVALLHSARAARRFAALIDDLGVNRASVTVAALSAGVAAAAGTGWWTRTAVDRPDDALLVALTRELIDRPAPGADKQPA